MAGDNTLGAPTEGLGQKVTFAFDPNNNTPTLSLDRGGVGRTGVQGGGTAGVGATQARGVAALGPNPTLAFLEKTADAILRPRLERAKQEAFFTGIQRAMAGEAVADIAKEQPWYSTLFGDTDVVEGARSYTAQSKAQTTVAAMEDNMAELRKLGPAEAQAYFNKTINAAMTGDKPTDAAMLQSMTRALPSIMRRQTKEHYGFQQEQATAAEAGAFKSGADRLQAAAKGVAAGFTTPEEMAQITDGFVRSVVPVAGRDVKNYKESMKDNLVNWAVSGNFHALNALRNKGFFDVLDADQVSAVERATEVGESKLRSKYSMDWNDDLAAVEYRAGKPPTGTSARDLAVDIDVLNKRFMVETGSQTGLIPPSMRAAMISGSAIKIAQERERQAERAEALATKRGTEGDKLAEKATKDSYILERAGEGTLGTLSRNKDFSKESIGEVVDPYYRSLPPAGQVKFLVNNFREDFVIDSIKDVRVGQINAALSSEQPTTDFLQAFQGYKALRDSNKEVADAYYGKHAVALEGFYNDLRNGVTEIGAFRDRFLGPGRRVKLDKQELKDVVSVVNDEQNSFLPEWMGGQKLKPGTARRVANEIAEYTERFAAATGNTKEAAKRALKSAKLNGLEIVGGYSWQNNKGQVNLTDWMTKNTPTADARVGTDKLNEEFEYAVDELLYGKDGTVGILPDTATDTYIGRLPDKAGVPMFHVQSVIDGKVYDGVLAATDIFTLAEKRRKHEANSTLGISNDKLRFGANYNPKPDNDAPSIYASPAEWAKYRERQKARAK